MAELVLCLLSSRLDILVVGSEELVIRSPLPVVGGVLLESDLNFFRCCRVTQGGVWKEWNGPVQIVLCLE